MLSSFETRRRKHSDQTVSNFMDETLNWVRAVA